MQRFSSLLCIIVLSLIVVVASDYNVNAQEFRFATSESGGQSGLILAETAGGENWGTICAQGGTYTFDFQAASSMCKIMGWEMSRTNYSYSVGSTNGYSHVMSMSCSSLSYIYPSSCSRSYSSTCTNSTDYAVYLNCYGIRTGHWQGMYVTQGYYFRLSKYLRRLEVRLGHTDASNSNNWGTVCNVAFTTTTANALCSWFGFSDSESGFFTAGGGSNEIRIDNLNCPSSAYSIADCTHATSGTCDHSQDVGLLCKTSDNFYLSGRFLLKRQTSGHIRAKRMYSQALSTMGYICDDFIDSVTAGVLYRITNGGVACASTISYSGVTDSSSGEFVLDDVVCNSSDNRSLAQCSYSETSIVCDPSQQLHLTCPPTTTATPTAVTGATGITPAPDSSATSDDSSSSTTLIIGAAAGGGAAALILLGIVIFLVFFRKKNEDDENEDEMQNKHHDEHQDFHDVVSPGISFSSSSQMISVDTATSALYRRPAYDHASSSAVIVDPDMKQTIAALQIQQQEKLKQQEKQQQQQQHEQTTAAAASSSFEGRLPGTSPFSKTGNLFVSPSIVVTDDNNDKKKTATKITMPSSSPFGRVSPLFLKKEEAQKQQALQSKTSIQVMLSSSSSGAEKTDSKEKSLEVSKDDLTAALRAASLCVAVVRGEADRDEVVSVLDQEQQKQADDQDARNTFESSVLSGEVEKWSKTLKSLPREDLADLHESNTSNFWSFSSSVFESLSSAPSPIGTIASLLGAMFGAVQKAKVNQYECQMLAMRTSRLLPIFIRAASENITAAGALYSEARASLDMCMKLVQKFVPPSENENENGEEKWIGERLWNFIKMEVNTTFLTGAEDFAECHTRLDRIIAEVSLAAQLDVHRDVHDTSRKLEEIKKSCDMEMQQTISALKSSLDEALKNATAETRAEIQASQAEITGMFSKIEKKLDSFVSIVKSLTREKEFTDLEIESERVEVLPDYCLGVGGQGAVYLCRFDRALYVAAKTTTASSKDEARRILREAKLMSKLKSPGITQCFGIATTRFSTEASPVPRTRVVLLMERCFCSVADLAEKRHLSFSMVFYFMGSVCSGLSALSRLGLAHRDIKPQNMLLAPGGAGVICKLHDFGSTSKMASLQQLYVTTTNTATTKTSQVGAAGTTFAYCAPELLNDQEAVATEASDIYSLGVSIYVLLSSGERVYRISRDQVMEENWNSEVISLIADCISHKPDRRPKIAEVMRHVEDLRDKYPLSEEEGDELLKSSKEIGRELMSKLSASENSNSKSKSKN